MPSVRDAADKVVAYVIASRTADAVAIAANPDLISACLEAREELGPASPTFTKVDAALRKAGVL